MPPKIKKKPIKSLPDFEMAFKNTNYMEFLENLPPESLFRLANNLGSTLFGWFGDPDKERIESLRTSMPVLGELLEFEKVFERLSLLDKFPRSDFSGVHLSSFFPELLLLEKNCISLTYKFSPGIQKAEYWLLPIAEKAAADADLEAAIYFASRGREEIIDVNRLRDFWHTAVCDAILQGRPLVPLPPEPILERAKARTLSLAEAFDLMSQKDGFLPSFFSFRDEEEDFIDATMLRAMEWLDVTGFARWADGLVNGISLGARFGVDGNVGEIGWWLFYWCRSDNAIRIADRRGWQSWFLALINSADDRERPWRSLSHGKDSPFPTDSPLRMRDYLPLAGMILFIWHRIKIDNVKESILQRASELLLQTQLKCGGWPLFADDIDACLLTTCVAIHGLALHRPRGWEKVVLRAADWLKSQQNPAGYWDIDGGPTVMLTVLVLDSLSLAEGNTKVTFSFPDETNGDVPAGEKIDAPNINTEPMQQVTAVKPTDKFWPLLSKILKALFVSLPFYLGRFILDILGRDKASDSSAIMLGYLLIIVVVLGLFGVVNLTFLLELFDNIWRYFNPLS
jgi:hypothetical protein